MNGRIPQDVADLLKNQTRTVLISLRRDGSPTADPLIGHFTNGHIYFNTHRKSRKAQNAIRSQISPVVTNPDRSSGALVTGVAKILDTIEARRLPARATDSKALSAAAGERAAAQTNAGKRIVC